MGNNLNDYALAPFGGSKQRGEVVYSYSGCLPIPRNLINNVSTLFLFTKIMNPPKRRHEAKKNKQNYEKSIFFAVDRRLRRHWHDILH
jgi:hypothetical protein